MNTIVDIWKELDAQLEEKFPKLYATLNPGASELEIKNLESHFSAPIPDDLKASLRVHNGQNDPNLTNGIFNFQVLLSCDRILEEFNMAYEIYNDTGPAWYDSPIKGLNTENGWSKGWVPFVSFQENCTNVDILPPDDGIYGQVFETRYQAADEVIFPSIKDWLHFYKEAIKNDRYENEGGVPYVTYE